MAKIKTANTPKSSTKSRPALSPEARENQLISLATDLVEQRLRAGTASSQETTHFLKLASTKARYEIELLKANTEVALAKKEALKSQKRVEELYADALKAMRNYNGQGDPDEYKNVL